MRLLFPRACVLLAALALGGCAAKGLHAQMASGENRANDAEHLLDKAEANLRALEPEKARSELEKAKELLSHPDVEFYPERTFLRERLARDEGLVPVAAQMRAQRELEEKVSKQRAALAEAMEPYKRALKVIESKRDLEEDDAEEAESRLDALKEVLEDGEKLEAKDMGYAASAKDARALVTRSEERVRLGALIVKFREGPGERSVEAKEHASRARKAGINREEKLEGWQDARDAYARCEEDGRALLTAMPLLGSRPVKVGGSVIPVKTVVNQCRNERKRLDSQVQRELSRVAAAEARAKAKERAAERRAATKRKSTSKR